MTELAEALTEALRPFGAPECSILEEDRKPDKKPWRIENDVDAEWAIRRLALARAAIADVDLELAAYVEQVEAWAAKAKERPLRHVEHFQALLADYMLRRNEADPEVKSINLPSGEITSRAAGGGWKVVDETILLAFLRGTAAVELRPHLLKSKANEFLVVKGAVVVDVDGEIVPGVEVVPERRSVTVRTDALS